MMFIDVHVAGLSALPRREVLYVSGTAERRRRKLVWDSHRWALRSLCLSM